MNQQTQWERCVRFHGHECGGLTIGFKAAQLAIEELGLNFSADEEVVCVSENDACGVDAIQVMLGCTAGKGNLLFHLTGKQAFSFYKRPDGESIRMILKERPEGVTREESFGWLQAQPPRELFDVMPARVELPEPARIFSSIACSKCGEVAAEYFIRFQNGEPVCLDCWHTYCRFSV